MKNKPVIKRGRGRPRKVVNTDSPSPVVVAEQIPVKEPEPVVQPEPVEEPEPVVQPEPVAEPETTKKTRKSNPWVEHCFKVRERPENQGKSYRDILKIAKLDYY
jgi:hypothetical protein